MQSAQTDPPNSQQGAYQQAQSGSITVPTDIAATPEFPPGRPLKIKFPVTLFSGKPRSFNPSWYSSYSWLEYSVD